jgi:glycosyltransferase involved in cell wall biosynthesis
MSYLRVAILVDLPREPASGGHVKYWERMAKAAVDKNLALDLTIYFSGAGDDEILSSHVRFRYLPPVFSSSRLTFLPYVPAHTDLALFHPRLARELTDYDVIHTTDGVFAFARTAERVARWQHIALTTSFHTDTPAYAELYTRQTLQSIFGHRFGAKIDRLFAVSVRERLGKEKRLKTHLRACSAILAMRAQDIALTQSVQTPDKIKPMRLGVDKTLFTPQEQARAEVERDFAIAPGKFMVLFVGRVDAGKNMPLLLQACAATIEKGIKTHLIVAGLGPMSAEVKAVLGENVTLVGQADPKKLAQLYAAVDCLAVASNIEIGGMIGLEAIACGCPVLVSRQSGMAQICGDPPAMQKVESSVAAWVDSLASLAQDGDKQKAMREAALKFREEGIAEWGDVLVEDFVSVWRNLAGEENNVR